MDAETKLTYSAMLEERQQKTDKANLGNEEQAMSIVDNPSSQVLKNGKEVVKGERGSC